MRKLIVIFITLVLVISCKKETNKNVKKENFPEELNKVFEKHGSVTAWRNFKTLSFNKGKEIHTVDLHSRKTAVHSPSYSLGYNGKEVWLSERDSSTFKGNKDFYYNLYFYFYAMPFVLADDGIIYEEVTPISFQGKEYPGYRISFRNNIGTSPEDTYIVYYNTATFQMEWLAYTVTFFTKKAAKKSNLIRYSQWEMVDGFLLPKEIIWYQKDENGQPTKPAKEPLEFSLPLVSKSELPASFYENPVE